MGTNGLVMIIYCWINNLYILYCFTLWCGIMYYIGNSYLIVPSSYSSLGTTLLCSFCPGATLLILCLIFMDCRSSSTWTNHLGRPLVLLPWGSHLYFTFTARLPDNFSKCPSKLRLCNFKNLTISALPISSPSSWFILILYVPSLHWVGPNIFLNRLCSKILNYFLSAIEWVYDSLPYISTS